MERVDIINTIGREYLTKTPRLEHEEYDYADEVGGKKELIKLLGYNTKHQTLDLRFVCNGVVVLVETKGSTEENGKKDSLGKSAQSQLLDYYNEEKVVNHTNKIICILHRIDTNETKVWNGLIDDEHFCEWETVIQPMEYYVNFFEDSKQNNREHVLESTYNLNEILKSMNISEKLRSQFVGTVLLYVKDFVTNKTNNDISQAIKIWNTMSSGAIIGDITDVLTNLLSKNEPNEIVKKTKVELLQSTVLEDSKVKALKQEDWCKILRIIASDIYSYIDINSNEGQDILNLFFIAFNKYVGREDKNQAFTPDHITEFMCQITQVDKNKIILDPTCGSGSFLVQALVKELADCKKNTNKKELKKNMDIIKKKHIYGIEVESKAYGLATTNMLIHGDGNSNIINANCFQSQNFIKEANPDIILMNPPYNLSPRDIPENYKKDWTEKEQKGKSEPTKGMIFVQYLSDIAKNMNKQIKLAVILPVSTAIGTSSTIRTLKKNLLTNNTLEAVFSFPIDIFFPGSNVCTCCMLFTLNKPHLYEGQAQPTFFGYCRNDGFKKKKGLGRVELFDNNGNSVWKSIETEWLTLFRNKKEKVGLSAVKTVSSEDEWLCEAYMETDYSKLKENNFKQVINNYLAFLCKEGIWNYSMQNISKIITHDILNINEWAYFTLKDLFNIQRGYTSDNISIEEGSTFYVSASADLNGVTKHVNNPSTFSLNTITVSNNGTVGEANYQPQKFVATSDVSILSLKEKWDVVLNVYIGLFICTILRMEKPKFDYGRKWGIERMNESKIKLPIKQTGQPDWEFMEQYIKSLPYGDLL